VWCALFLGWEVRRGWGAFNTRSWSRQTRFEDSNAKSQEQTIIQGRKESRRAGEQESRRAGEQESTLELEHD
jgi:hypothetical protein